MKEAANSLLKILEEPPDFATIFLLADNAGELLPTIRSRSMISSLVALSSEEVETISKGTARTGMPVSVHWWPGFVRAPLAALVRSTSTPTARPARTLWQFFRPHCEQASIRELFKVTETYRAGAEGREKIERLLRTLYSLLQDLVFLNSGTSELVRNRDIQTELVPAG